MNFVIMFLCFLCLPELLFKEFVREVVNEHYVCTVVANEVVACDREVSLWSAIHHASVFIFHAKHETFVEVLN